MRLKINDKLCKFDGSVETDAATLIRSIMMYEGVKQEELADKLCVSQVAVSRCLARNMRVDTFESMLNSLGYCVIVDKIRNQ